MKISQQYFRRETFLSGLAWMSDYVSAMELGEEELLPVVMVGNKNDVEDHVAKKEYNTWVEDNNVIGFYEVSARSNTNIDTAINTLLRHILTHDSAFVDS